MAWWPNGQDAKFTTKIPRVRLHGSSRWNSLCMNLLGLLLGLFRDGGLSPMALNGLLVLMYSQDGNYLLTVFRHCLRHNQHQSQRSTFCRFRVRKSNRVPACLAGIKGRCVYLCQMAGNIFVIPYDRWRSVALRCVFHEALCITLTLYCWASLAVVRHYYVTCKWME